MAIGKRRWTRLAGVGALGIVIALVVTTGAPRPSIAGPIDYPGYLGGPLHTSNSSATAITTANAGSLLRRWVFHAGNPTMPGQPFPSFQASPTVFQNMVFIGSNSGVLYALNEDTGKTIWHAFTGFVPKLTCGSARGLTATAAAGFDPSSGLGTVYVPGGDGYLYALDAATGTQRWRSLVALPSTTVNDYYNWSSAAVANGRVYVGVSSQCDKPLVRGGVRTYDQATGTLLSTYNAVPAGALGGGVWSSPAVSSGGFVLATTGTPPKSHLGDAPAVVELDRDGNKLDAWTVPLAQQASGDADFGGSPTIFTAMIGGVQHELAGECNKNGLYYALDVADVSAGPVWSFQVGIGTPQGVLSCLASTAFDGQRLYLAGNQTTIAGTTYAGNVRALDPATGAVLWETGLNSVVLGSPSVNANKVMAAATYGNGVLDGVYLIDGTNGHILTFMATGKQFAQPVYADQYLLIANHNSLSAWAP